MTFQAAGADWVRARVAGKVNLGLRVGGVRADGYHPLATLFQALSLHDEVWVRPAEPGTFPITISGDQADLVPADDSNLAVRAARLLAEEHGDPSRLGAEIHIRKAIPVTGGMAGGSADCAGALLAAAYLWDLDVDADDLAELGATLGADVPFALMGQTALGRGRGDELVPVLSRGTYHWVLAFSEGELSTPAVFRRWDELNPDAAASAPDVPQGLLEALASGEAAALAPHLVNDLQAAAVSLRPELEGVLEAGLEAGAMAGIVSGSGPTCAFLAANEAAAVDVSVRLSGMGVCRAVRRAVGPVPGARLLG